jgi:hypothetical protein
MIASSASPSTVSTVMRTLSSERGAAVDDGKIPANPLLGLQRPKVILEPRQALSAEQPERVRAKHPTQADRVLWGLPYAAGLRTEEALAVGWSNFLELSRARCTLEVDRVFVSDHIRHTTKTGRGRDQEIVAPLAADLIELPEKVPPGSSDALVCSSRTGTPVNLNNGRNRVFNPAAIAGNSPEVIWKHNAREFDRSRTVKPVPLEAALRAA